MSHGERGGDREKMEVRIKGQEVAEMEIGKLRNHSRQSNMKEVRGTIRKPAGFPLTPKPTYLRPKNMPKTNVQTSRCHRRKQ